MNRLSLVALLVLAVQVHAAPDAGVKKVPPKKAAAVDAGVKAAVTVDAGVKATVDAGVATAPAAATGTAKYTLVAIAAPDKKIERLWKSKCGSCHGADGKAVTEKGKKMKMSDLSAAAWQTSRGNDELKKATAEGVKATKDGVEQEMDAYGKELTPEQIEGLVTYVRWLGAPR